MDYLHLLHLLYSYYYIICIFYVSATTTPFLVMYRPFAPHLSLMSKLFSLMSANVFECHISHYKRNSDRPI